MKSISTTGWFRPLRAFTRSMRKGQWTCRKNAPWWIRTHFGRRTHCPLTFVAAVETGKEFSASFQWRTAGDAIGLPVELQIRIAAAADISGDPLNETTARMRRILERAAGLKGNWHG